MGGWVGVRANGVLSGSVPLAIFFFHMLDRALSGH